MVYKTENFKNTNENTRKVQICSAKYAKFSVLRTQLLETIDPWSLKYYKPWNYTLSISKAQIFNSQTPRFYSENHKIESDSKIIDDE